MDGDDGDNNSLLGACKPGGGTSAAQKRGYNESTKEAVHIRDADGVESTCRRRREWVPGTGWEGRVGKGFGSVSLIFGY